MFKRILTMIFYGVSMIFFATVVIFVISSIEWPLRNDLPKKEIVSSGYKFLIFGNQNFKGLELYDFESGKFKPFLVPENNAIRYVEPVIGESGKGYCIKEENPFDLKNRKDEIITFDMKTLEKRCTRTVIRQKYANLAISSDEKRLAFIFSPTDNNIPLLGLYDTVKEKIEKAFPIDRSFFENPIKILWKPDNKSIVIWTTLANGPPAIEFDIELGSSYKIDNFPLAYKHEYMLAMDDKKESVYLLNLESGNKETLIKKNVTGHSFSLSRDGKYFVYGWLRGIGGFEILTIMDIKTKRELQISLKKHPSTVSGLALW